MPKTKYKNENDVYQVLGVSDLKNLSKEKVIQLVNTIPEIDPKVALKMLEQIPEFSKTATTMVGYLKDTVKSVLKENNSSSDRAFRAYEVILNNFSEQLKKPFITKKEKREITEKMIEIADKIAAKDSENKTFLSRAVNGVGVVVAGTIGVFATILGVRFFIKK